jgi:cytochrome P450
LYGLAGTELLQLDTGCKAKETPCMSLNAKKADLAEGAPTALTAAAHTDPYPFYARIRRKQPLYLEENSGIWIASDARTVRAAFAHAALCVRPPNEPVPKALTGTVAGEVFSLLIRMNDGAFHAEQKRMVETHSAALRLQSVERLANEVMDLALSRFTANELMMELPVRVLAAAMHVPPAEIDATTRQVRTFARGIAPGAGAASVSDAATAAADLMAAWQRRGFDRTGAARRIGLMQQSVDATAGLLGNTVLRMLRYPDEASACMQLRETACDFVAEVARWDAPIQNTRRFAAQSFLFEGNCIHEGQAMLLLLASANRDSALNERPDEFDANRTDRRSMTFGSGAHACSSGLVAIEIVAAWARNVWATGRFNSYFGPTGHYLPLVNARIPIFE